ncbi:MAG: RluA family pseudouridine synthase, partial [Ruminococcaceae bacterium]|nr:RluA family pseudouridine synthase [Oscillospiraceae bacterium]
MTQNVIVNADDAGKRVDAFLAEKLSITRSAAVKLLEGENVLLEGKCVSKSLKVACGQNFEVTIPEPEPSEALPENIPLDIIYEDSDLLVINKPKGMVVHPAAGNPSGTLVNALLYHCGDSLSGIGGVIRPGIVHRIDKDTSGLLVVAKNDETHLALSEQLKDHTVSRIYSAIALGNFKQDSGTVDAPIGRHPNDRKKMAVLRNSDSAREAITHYSIIERYGDFSYIKCVLETGRTHQIRVHMSSIGHPLLGDEVYGGSNTKFEARNRALISGQCLHAGELSFIHPRTREKVH